MTRQAVVNAIRAQIRKHGTQRAYAAHIGVSQQYLCDVLNGRRDISAELAGLLGYERITLYAKVRKAVTK